MFYHNSGRHQLFRPGGDLDEELLAVLPGSIMTMMAISTFHPRRQAFGTHNHAFTGTTGKFTKLTADQVGPIVADGKTGYASGAADYDNDGYLDLFVSVPGRLDAGETGDNKLLYHNNGDGTFSRVTTGSLVHDGGVSGGCAWGDYNNDGFMDLVVANGLE
jgi:hypothetical protein